MNQPHHDADRAALEREVKEARAEVTAVHELCEERLKENAWLQDRNYKC